MKKIAIVGLGLMGGSLAKALKVKQNMYVCGIDQEDKTILQAFEDGVIAEGYTEVDLVNWDAFDIIFLCTPLEKTLEVMKKIDGKVKDTAIVTDITSTKETMIELAMEMHYDFIGGHPMVGSEKYGYKNSKYHLFENAYYVITPLPDTATNKIKSLQEILTSIGAIPIEVEATRHDLVTAIISHVPHIVAASLVHMVSSNKDNNILLKLAAGGFKDITRIASSNPKLWKQITLSNKGNISYVIKGLIAKLEELHLNILKSEEDYIFHYFNEAKKIRDLFPDNIVTNIANQYEVIVDIEDKPGQIARISTLLYESSINIKNIGIMNNREYENGVLKIVFENQMDQENAAKVLKTQGYPVF